MADIKDKNSGGETEKSGLPKENGQESGAAIQVSGISGTKILRVGRVKKKAKDADSPKEKGSSVAEVKEQSSVSAVDALEVNPVTPTQKETDTPVVDIPKAPATDMPSASVDEPVSKVAKKPEDTVNKDSIQASPKEEKPEKSNVAETSVKQEPRKEDTPSGEKRTGETSAKPSQPDKRVSSVQPGRTAPPEFQPRRTNPPLGNAGRPPISTDTRQTRPHHSAGDSRPPYRPAGDTRSARPAGAPRSFHADGSGSTRSGYAQQGGNYQGRPGGGYRSGPQGSGGYGRGGGGFSRGREDGFVRHAGKDDDEQPRFQSKGHSQQKPKSDIPLDPKEKSKLAKRESLERTKKEVTKDSPKKESPRTAIAQSDKRSGNRKAATAGFVGRGASEILEDDRALETFYTPKRGRRGRKKPQSSQEPQTQIAVLTHVQLPDIITVKDFSEGIQKRSGEVIKKLLLLGVMATINQEIDFDTATLIAEEYGITTERIVEVSEEDILFDDTEDDEETLVSRPPVVVVMGHVDHGKTSLLDKIRSASVVAGEAGGITQHIGAYMVQAKDRQITFLDTPGHEAFTTMRARGAQVTDVAILVVAADDGVMPQTIEAINHAKAANTELVVAINKIDKPGANAEKVKQELAVHEVVSEEWGGSTIMVPVSAKTGEGIDKLFEMVLLTADVLELKSDPDKQAKGTVIEAKLDKNKGPVATVLVQRGTLRTGDTMVTGHIFGRIRAMTDDRGSKVKTAGPSVPVEILGLPEVPEAGELFYAVTDDKVARQLVEKRRIKQREEQLKKSSRMSLETLSLSLAAGEVQDLKLIVKADVQGSVEAVRQSLERLSSNEVRVRVIHGAVGTITESDVMLAEVSNAIIVGFNVRPGINITEMAEDKGVDIKLYRVIYHAIEDVEAAMKGLLKPTFEEVVLGHVEIRQTFKVSNVGTIGGGYVLDGKVSRSSDVRVVRDGIVVYEGHLASLKRFKDDVKEVSAGYECGISIEKYNDIKDGDVIEAFEMKEVTRK